MRTPPETSAEGGPADGPLDRSAAVPARAGGALLATGIAALAAVRRVRKPFHPHGRVATGVVRRHGGERPSGVTWLDEMGEDPVLVRLSRAVGLPKPLPDIFGIALRIPGDDGPADLLLATTGGNALTRYLLAPHREGHERVYGSLMPYRSPSGPVVLSALRTGERAFELRWARPTGAWTTFGRLELDGEPGPDEPISFDPITHPLPGLQNYDWVTRLREPSYLVARRTSHRPARP
jgi:hypothetical protein